jgi:hypothetical protein
MIPLSSIQSKLESSKQDMTFFPTNSAISHFPLHEEVATSFTLKKLVSSINIQAIGSGYNMPYLLSKLL